MSEHTVTVKKTIHSDRETWLDCECTGPDSYDTDGSGIDLVAAAAAYAPPTTVVLSDQMIVTQPSDTYVHCFVPATELEADKCKIKWMMLDDGTEVVSTTDLSAVTFRARFRVFNTAED